MAQIAALLLKIVMEVIYIKVEFRQRSERRKEVSHADIWRKNHQAIQLPYKVPEMAHLRYGQVAGVAAI